MTYVLTWREYIRTMLSYFVGLLLFHVVSKVMELKLLFQSHSVLQSLTHIMIWCVCIVTMLF